MLIVYIYRYITVQQLRGLNIVHVRVCVYTVLSNQKPQWYHANRNDRKCVEVQSALHHKIHIADSAKILRD